MQYTVHISPNEAANAVEGELKNSCYIIVESWSSFPAVLQLQVLQQPFVPYIQIFRHLK